MKDKKFCFEFGLSKNIQTNCALWLSRQQIKRIHSFKRRKYWPKFISGSWRSWSCPTSSLGGEGCSFIFSNYSWGGGPHSFFHTILFWENGLVGSYLALLAIIIFIISTLKKLNLKHNFDDKYIGLQVQGLTSNNPRSSLTTIEQAPLQVFNQEDHLNGETWCHRGLALILFPFSDPDPVSRRHHLEVWHHSFGEVDRAQTSCLAGNDCSH